MSNIFPCCAYDDAPAAIEWLCRAFGFEKRMVVDGPNGTVVHAELALGGDVVMLSSSSTDGPLPRAAPDRQRPTAQSIYIAVTDVDAHHHRARRAGAEILMELTDTDYGSRDYIARDPEGHVWCFGTYKPDATKSA